MTGEGNSARRGFDWGFVLSCVLSSADFVPYTLTSSTVKRLVVSPRLDFDGGYILGSFVLYHEKCMKTGGGLSQFPHPFILLLTFFFPLLPCTVNRL